MFFAVCFVCFNLFRLFSRVHIQYFPVAYFFFFLKFNQQNPIHFIQIELIFRARTIKSKVLEHLLTTTLMEIALDVSSVIHLELSLILCYAYGSMGTHSFEFGCFFSQQNLSAWNELRWKYKQHCRAFVCVFICTGSMFDLKAQFALSFFAIWNTRKYHSLTTFASVHFKAFLKRKFHWINTKTKVAKNINNISGWVMAKG